MARDIAFVADKDTPEDALIPQDPVPVTDGPRSEGSQAARAFPTVPATDLPEPAATAENEPLPAEADAAQLSPPGVGAIASRIESIAPRTTEPAPVEPEILPEATPPPEISRTPEAAETTARAPAPEEPTPAAEWTAPPERAPPHTDDVAYAETHPPLEAPEPIPPPSLPEAASVPAVPAPESVEPETLAPGPTTAELQVLEPPAPQLKIPEPPLQPEPSLDPAPPEPADTHTFTAAAEGLFRPPELHASDDPHLITTGRRLHSSSAPLRPTLTVPPQPEPVAEHSAPPADVWKHRLRKGLRYAAYAAAAYLLLVVLLILLFRFVNPPGSMLMLKERLGGTAIDRTWIPFAAISPSLIRSVIVSEDSRFCQHRGVDLEAIRLALQETSRGAPRGASTISMQVTKNLFLWNAKSYLRKVIEIPLTLVMEIVWPKERIVEVYLNIAEWGPGVFGAEAASRHHFGKSASNLTAREAALLAASLPNPHVRVAGNPGPRTSRMARVIQTRVKAFGSVAQCVVTRQQTAAAAPPATAASGRASAVGATTRPTATAPPANKANTPAKKPGLKQVEAKKDSRAAKRPDDWGTTLRFGP